MSLFTIVPEPSSSRFNSPKPASMINFCATQKPTMENKFVEIKNLYRIVSRKCHVVCQSTAVLYWIEAVFLNVAEFRLVVIKCKTKCECRFFPFARTRAWVWEMLFHCGHCIRNNHTRYFECLMFEYWCVYMWIWLENENMSGFSYSFHSMCTQYCQIQLQQISTFLPTISISFLFTICT